MGFRYDFNKLPEKQVKLAYESDINELKRKLHFLQMLDYTYGIPERELERIDREMAKTRMELQQLELEYELARF